MIVNPPKALNLIQLKDELAAAGIRVSALGSKGDVPNDVHTYDANGLLVDLPAAAATVVAAHVADPNYVPANAPDGMLARVDLATQYPNAMTRLDQIIGATNPTNAQRDAAVQDMATILKRTLRLLKDIAT